ncbi:hypothetical protein GQ53DRAFT_815158 [Thozetella sp. PMI_491]|nr:hypothetical protein GQ53DRAFT_815158 [Thozetella sp. PMI_491]
MQFTALARALGLASLLGSAVAVNLCFYNSQNCRGSVVCCNNVGANVCCGGAINQNFAASGGIQNLQAGQVAVLFVDTGGHLGQCVERWCVGGNGCCTANLGMPVTAGSRHVGSRILGADASATKCTSNATINSIASIEGESAWILNEEDVAPGSFAGIVDSFNALPEGDREDFLKSHGAVLGQSLGLDKTPISTLS